MIVLDTHIWLWWINEDAKKLGSKLQMLIAEEDSVGVSAISCFEVAWLYAHARISLRCDVGLWFENALEGSDITLLPISPEIAIRAAELPEHHSDPQDRLIIATAISYNAPLASKDTKFRLYEGLDELLL